MLRNRKNSGQEDTEQEVVGESSTRDTSVVQLNGGCKCVLATTLILSIIAVILAAAAYAVAFNNNSLLKDFLPDANVTLASSSSRGMESMTGAIEAFRKRQQALPPT